jgi:hypothetical protein
VSTDTIQRYNKLRVLDNSSANTNKCDVKRAIDVPENEIKKKYKRHL